MKSNKVFQVILWVLVALLSVSFFLFLNVGLQDLYWYFDTNTAYDDDYYEYLLEEENYTHMIYTLAQNNQSEEQPTEKYKEFSAIAEYYKAASLYKAYMAVEDMDSAAMQQTIMERCVAEIEEYETHIDNINRILELETK